MIFLRFVRIGLTTVSRLQRRSWSGSIRGSRTSDEGTKVVQGHGTVTLNQAFSDDLFPLDIARKRHNFSCMKGSLTENAFVSGVVEGPEGWFRG